MFCAIQEQFSTDGLTVDFYKRETSSGLNGLLKNDGLKGMLEGNDCSAFDYIFPLVEAFGHCFLGRLDTQERTTAQSRYKDLMNLVKFDVD